MRKRRFPWSKQKIILLRAGLVLLAIAALLSLLDSRMRPVVVDMATHQARVAAMQSINGAMGEAIGEQGVSYEDVITVTQNGDGEVTSIQSNMVLINFLKVQVTQQIMEEIGKTENQKLKIPLGTLSGVQYASGRGPIVEVKALPYGNVQTRVYNQFISAGINQTLHRIMLEASVQMMVVLPGHTVRTETLTEYCIAETVIVGKIPESYTDINGDDSSLIAKTNDYSWRGQ